MLISTSSRRRPGFTLMEMILASAIGLLIMYGLYVAVQVQLGFADSSRRIVEQAALARSLTARIASDIAPCVGIPDPGRFQSTNSSSSGSGSTSSQGSSTTGSSTGSSSGSNTGSTSSDGSTPTTGTGSESTTDTSGGVTGDPTTDPVRAIYGDAGSLRLYVSRVPNVLTGAAATDEASANSDQRVIEYWLTQSGGLARQEIPVVTAAPGEIPWARGSATEEEFVIAPEVTGLEFSYFDGTDWVSTWNSLQVGADGKTPIGPPTAIAIVLQMTMPGPPDTTPRVQQFRQVIAIPTANGLPMESGTTGTQDMGTTTGGTTGTQP